MIRFNHDANTFEEAKDYYRNRAVQLLADNVKLLGFEVIEPWGVKAHFQYNWQTCQSVYVLKDYRRKGHLSKYLGLLPSTPFITMPDCDLESFFQTHRVPYFVVGKFTQTDEYKAISAFYGDKRAKRSQVPLMNHIDEGLAVLVDLGASHESRLAFCMHRLFQEDSDLVSSYSRLPPCNPAALVLAMEYRYIANSYLSTRKISSIDEIYLGPLPEVRLMLIADKIQNYKDFLRYHRMTHPRGEELDEYFQNWLRKLEISQEQFRAWSERLTISLVT